MRDMCLTFIFFHVTVQQCRTNMIIIQILMYTYQSMYITTKHKSDAHEVSYLILIAIFAVK